MWTSDRMSVEQNSWCSGCNTCAAHTSAVFCFVLPLVRFCALNAYVWLDCSRGVLLARSRSSSSSLACYSRKQVFYLENLKMIPGWSERLYCIITGCYLSWSCTDLLGELGKRWLLQCISECHLISPIYPDVLILKSRLTVLQHALLLSKQGMWETVS